MSTLNFPDETTSLVRVARGVIPATEVGVTFVIGAKLLGNFPSYLTRLTANTRTQSVPDTTFSVYDAKWPHSWHEALTSIDHKLKHVFFQKPDQILKFLEYNAEFLRKDGWATYFPFAVGLSHYVIGVGYLEGIGRCTSICELSNPCAMDARSRYIIPEIQH
jgi:hypothetical protein